MLDNEQLRRALERLRTSSRVLPYRTPTFAGRAYPADPNELCHYLDQFISIARDHDEFTNLPEIPALSGLLSPHIDYTRGGPVYGSVWHHAATAVENADLVVMIGTDHYGNDPFTLTRQSYATPYGILPTAGDIVDKLASAIDNVSGAGASFNGEFRHQNEHSLELVAVWLHHMLQKRERASTESCELVPILCGGLHRHIMRGSDPADDPVLKCVLDVLHDVSTQRNVLVVASGDLAHVGPAFSGAPLNAQQRTLLRNADDALIQSMTQGDSDAFFELIRSVGDRNNVCGVTPIYLTMRLLAALKRDANVVGTTVAYDTCPADEMNTSVVTIGGVLFS